MPQAIRTINRNSPQSQTRSHSKMLRCLQDKDPHIYGHGILPSWRFSWLHPTKEKSILTCYN